MTNDCRVANGRASAGHAADARRAITNIRDLQIFHSKPLRIWVLGFYVESDIVGPPFLVLTYVMPARSISTATISFGLVSVPVNVYSSAESKSSVSFNMLHKKCNGRLKQQYICPKDGGEVVERTETVKGYEFAKDQYVILSPEELKALEEKATGAIDILEFVPLAKVNREYVSKCYYLGPDKGGDRAYRLLARALKESGKAA